MTRTILLDGDITAYQFASMAEKPVEWEDGLWTLHSHLPPTIADMDDHINGIMERLNGDHLIVALSDKDNFRKKILPTYKSNRKDTRKPLVLMPLREHIRDHYKVFERPGLEGDDVLGILATSKHIVKGEKIIVSIDKDMKTIPAKIANMRRIYEGLEEGTIKSWEEGIVDVTQAEADRFHMIQTLAGDATDGYSGCPGVGMQTAAEIVDNPVRLIKESWTPSRGKNAGVKGIRWVEGDPCSVWDAVVCQFSKAGFGKTEAVTQARVSRILRSTDYDFKKKAPILWKPASK